MRSRLPDRVRRARLTLVETSFGCVIVFVIVTSAGSRAAPCKGAQILLAAEMVAEPWFMAGGLIPPGARARVHCRKDGG